MAGKEGFLFLALFAQIALGSSYHGPTAIPHVLKSGYLADTQEVSTAKVAHLAALAKESHHGPGGDYSGSYGHGGDDDNSYGRGYSHKYHGPTAVPHVLKSGYLADTQDVSAAKVAHLAALAKESHHGHGGDYSGSYGHGGDDGSSYGHGYSHKYLGPTTVPHVLDSGYLADTQEVSAAKVAHLAALAKESHHGYGGDYGESHGHRADYPSYSHGRAVQYHGPTGRPVVLKTGYLEDTHDVAAAKDEHYAILSKSKSSGLEEYSHGKSWN